MLTDAITHVRRHRSMYFCPAVRLASGLAEEALILGCRNVCITRHSERWIVMAEDDWFRLSNISVPDLFKRILPLVEAGPNSMWVEIVLAAFCAQVATWSRNDELVVNGDPVQWSTVWDAMRLTFPGMRRFVAFTAPE